MDSIRKGARFWIDSRRWIYEGAAPSGLALMYSEDLSEYREVKLGDLIDEDPEETEYAVPAIEAKASAEDWALAEFRYSALKDYVEADDSKVGDLAAKLKISEPRAYALVKIFKNASGPADFLKDKPGIKQGKRLIPTRVEAIVALSIEQQWKGPGSNIAGVVKYVEELCDKAGLKAPAVGTVANRIRCISQSQLAMLRDGHKSANDMYQPRPRKNKASHPLAKTEMDHCLVDCIIVDEKTRMPLCRPWVTVIIDLHTRVLVGYYLSIDAPSSFSVAQAITHATFPKDDWLAHLDLEDISYPYYGKLESLAMDNAKEFKAKALKIAATKHAIKLNYRPPGRPWWGGHIERLFGTLAVGYIHFLPGTTMSNVVQKGDYDSEGKACLTFSEFETWFARAIAIYHNTEHRSIKQTPHDKWMSAWTDSEGRLRQPAIVENKVRFSLDFYPEKMRTISRQGIEMYGFRYWSGALSAYVKKKVAVKYNPLSLRFIWVNPTGERYVRVPFADLTLADLSLQELKAANRQIKSASEVSGKRQVSKREVFRLVEKNREIVEAAKRATKTLKKMQESRSVYKDRETYINSDEKTRVEIQQPDDDFATPPTLFKIEFE